MSDKFMFHFTVGPVQGFVAQARRTRDLWAGSYLLSCLAGAAMREIAPDGTAVAFPRVGEDGLFKAIAGESHPKKEDIAARVGSLPNRFKAEAEDAKKAAESAAAALDRAWQKIASVAWSRLEEETGKGEMPATTATKEMFDRQIAGQWEIAWVVGDEGVLLDQRKNMRTHFPPEEPGEKCTLCGERQALSQGPNDHPDAVRKWWEQVAAQFNRDTGRHFLSEGGERLCGVCSVKRLFPLISKAGIGWETPPNFPSTSHMAAVDWLKHTLQKAVDNPKVADLLVGFIGLATKAGVLQDETATSIPGIEKLLKGHDEWRPVADFTGDVFFPDAIRNKKDFSVAKGQRQSLLNALKKLTDTVDEQPSPFYALLLMDGDNMGKLLSENPGKQGAISDALAEFTGTVAGIVEQGNDGRLVFAGGDDVFAILPLDTALSCAKQIRESYVSAFQKHAPEITSKGGGTISAAIVYAHMNTPLQAVVRDAHTLLDKTAKDEYGRDAFAVRVWKRGGPVLTYGRKWVEKDWVGELEYFREAYRDKEFSSGLFYRVRELEPVLEAMNNDAERAELLTAEYLGSRDKLGLSEDSQERRKEAERRIKRLMALCRGKEHITAEGALLVRFLAEKGVER